MAKKRKKVPYPDISSAASATETTGMMARAPDSDEEYDSFLDIYGVQVPKRDELNKEKK